ncbi:MAG TPA: hypothetical protein VJA21_34570 [Verrucomicrobiae bacterium]
MAALSLSAAAWGSEPFRAGPLYDEFQLTLSPGQRVEAAGPFFYEEEKEAERTWAIPPLLSYARNPDLEMEEFDFVYPILTYDRYGDQYRWQLFQLLSFAGGPTQTETNRNRFTLYPLFFSQRSSDTNENYTAYGPFYGHLKHRLMRDEIFYVMFPFYSQTRKKDVVTRNYVYPFFHLRHGDGLEGWQVWPLTGHEQKTVTTRTNMFGDLEMVPGHEKRFVLWPIYFNQTTGIGTTNEAKEQAVIPAYSLLRSPARDSTTVLWPFFSRIDDREKGYLEWDAPWPLIVFARGPGKYTSRVFPFYSHAYNTNLQSDFFLWPVYKYNRLQSGALDRRRTRICFFLYSDVTEKNTETSAYRRRTEMWPFFTRKRDLNGNTRLQVLALLEPLVPGTHKIDRDYSPLWSLWRDERNVQTGAASQSLLWNLYRRDVRPDSKKISLFFGLYQSRQDAEGKMRKLFFIPISRSTQSETGAGDIPADETSDLSK